MISTIAMAGAGSAAEDSGTRAERAVKDFESLFIETLLQSSGMLKSLDTEGAPEGAMVSELMVRELASQLSGQLRLDFGRNLGIDSATTAALKEIP